MTYRTRPHALPAYVSALFISALSLGIMSAAPAAADPGATPPPGYVLPAHVPYYVVPPDNNVFAYALASQLLGNGNLDTTIFQLNQGRLQPTGDAWSQLATIEPGWYLILPCDATGSDAGSSVQWNPPPQDVPPSQVPASALCPATVGPAATPEPVATATGSGSVAGPTSGVAVPGTTPAKPTATVPAKAAGSGKGNSSQVPLVIGAGLLILAALGGFSWWRSRSAEVPVGAGAGNWGLGSLKPGGGRTAGKPAPAKSTPPKPAAVSKSVAPPKRSPAQPAAAQPPATQSASARPGLPKLGRRKLPPPVTDALLADPQTVAIAAQSLALLTTSLSWWPYAAAVSGTDVTVWLAGMDVPAPPEPWRPADGDSRAWTLSRNALAALVADGPVGESTIPAVLGVLDDAVVVLELSRSHGVLAVGGDPRWAPQVHESLAGQVAGGEVLLRVPGEPDPVGGRPHWALEADAEGWVSVHGRRVRFAAPPPPEPEEAPEPIAQPATAPAATPMSPVLAVSAAAAERFPAAEEEDEPDLGSIAVSAQPPARTGETDHPR